MGYWRRSEGGTDGHVQTAYFRAASRTPERPGTTQPSSSCWETAPDPFQPNGIATLSSAGVLLVGVSPLPEEPDTGNSPGR